MAPGVHRWLLPPSIPVTCARRNTPGTRMSARPPAARSHHVAADQVTNSITKHGDVGSPHRLLPFNHTSKTPGGSAPGVRKPEDQEPGSSSGWVTRREHDERDVDRQ